jgi:hypothetical protein
MLLLDNSDITFEQQIYRQYQICRNTFNFNRECYGNIGATLIKLEMKTGAHCHRQLTPEIFYTDLLFYREHAKIDAICRCDVISNN